MRLALLAHHVAPLRPPFVGGVESVTWALAEWLARRGHDVTCFAPPGSRVPGVRMRTLELAPELSARGRADVSMPPPAFMGAHHAYLRAMLELAADADRYDLVHVNTLHYLPVALASLVPAPVLLSLHTPPTPWLESALRAGGGEGLCVSAVSHATAAMWADVLTVDRVVPNGVDLRRWRPGPGGTDAVWMGRIVPEKAPHLAIDAARAAGLAIRLAGPIIDADYFAREVAPRLDADAVYVGHLEQAELARLVGGSRVAVVSPVWDEPFGLVAAEALACGTPVAAFARGGLPTVVGPGAGCLVAGDTAVDLAAAIEVAAAGDRATARAHARVHLGVDAMGRGYERLYDELVFAADAVPVAS